jgi:hypothetical protein
MSEEDIRSIRVIHRLERSIRILELARDLTRQKVIQAIECHEMNGDSAETITAVSKAHAQIAVYNRTIHRAKARIKRLERGD